jgi:hypothetical protein
MKTTRSYLCRGEDHNVGARTIMSWRWEWSVIPLCLDYDTSVILILISSVLWPKAVCIWRTKNRRHYHLRLRCFPRCREVVWSRRSFYCYWPMSTVWEISCFPGGIWQIASPSPYPRGRCFHFHCLRTLDVFSAMTGLTCTCSAIVFLFVDGKAKDRHTHHTHRIHRKAKAYYVLGLQTQVQQKRLQRSDHHDGEMLAETGWSLLSQTNNQRSQTRPKKTQVQIQTRTTS